MMKYLEAENSVWWTVLRAFVICLCGLAIQSALAHMLPRTATIVAENERSDPNVLDSLLALERGVEAKLTRLRELELEKLANFQCPAPDASQAAVDPNQTPPGNGLADFQKRVEIKRLRELSESAVVFIQTDKGNGTGFFVTPTLIMTNAHVVGESESVSVFSETLFPQTVRGQVLFRTPDRGNNLADRDYAIVEVAPQTGVVPLKLNTSVAELDPVVSVGFPGLFQSFQQTGLPRLIFRSGEIIDSLPQKDGRNVIAHSAEVFQGNSGGPLLNACGHVVGINTFIIWSDPSGKQNSNKVKTDFALPSSDMIDFFAEHSVEAAAAKECIE